MEPNLASQFPTANALGLKASQITGLKFNPITPTPIDANSLGNTQPFKLPNQQTPTLASGLNGYISSLSTADSLGQQLQRENQMALDTAGKKKTGLTQKLADYFSGRKGEATLTGEAYDTEGVDVAKKALGEVNTKITAIDVKANEEIKKIRENRVGASASAINDEIERVQREAATDKADLYLEKLVAQGDYDSAKEIADRKVAMQLEADSMQYEALKLAYEDNKDQYTSAEQRAYELKLDQYKTSIETEKEEKTAINELAINALSNGAPSSLVQQALKVKTQDEALGLIGSYVNALDRRKATADMLKAEAEAKQVLEVGNAASGEFASVINTAANLLGAEKAKTSRTEIASALARKDYATAFANIANNVEQNLTGEAKNKFANARTDYAVLTGLKDAIQKYADAGGDMGLLVGSEESIKRKLGIDSGQASVLATELWREFQTYRNNMTGAAFSASESADYASVNPTLKKSLNLNMSVIDGALNQLENRVLGTIETRVPKATNIYKLIDGVEQEVVKPEEATVGSIIDFGGQSYRVLGNNRYEEI